MVDRPEQGFGLTSLGRRPPDHARLQPAMSVSFKTSYALTGRLHVMTTVESRTVTIRIERPLGDVYTFLAEPRNFQKWAAGLDLDNEITYTEDNRFGIVDHTVRTAGGQEVYVPMRAIRNGTGTEVLFTLLRQPDMTDEVFMRDAHTVQQDLLALKRVLES